jgi:hypothetical protein
MHMRSLVVASAIGLSLACIAGFASAQQIYKWKDANGVTHFSQTPPPSSGTPFTKMHLTSEPDVSSNPPPASAGAENTEPGSAAAPRNAPASSSQPDTAANRAELCKQLSSNISLLQGKQPVVTDGSGGKQEVMSDNAREAQLATARAQQAQYCSTRGN